MEKSPKKKKKFLKFLFFLLIIFGLFLTLIYFSLPFIIENIIVPIFAPKLGIENYSMNVEKADLSGLKVSSVRIFGKEKTGIKIDLLTIQAEYAELQSLDVDGLDLHFDFKNGDLSIPGIIFPKKNKQKSQNDKNLFPSILSPDFKVSIINSKLSLDLEKRGKLHNIKLPFEIKLERKNDIINFYTKAKALHYKDENFELSLPVCELSGTIEQEKNRLFVQGFAKFANISFKKGKIKIPKIEGEVPFGFYMTENGFDFKVPKLKNQAKGFVEIPEILFGKKSFGKMHFSIFQQEGDFILKGEHSKLIKDQKTFLEVKITPPSGGKQLSAELRVSFKGEDLDLELSQFHPKAGAACFMGNIEISGKGSWKNNAIFAQTKIKIRDGIFEDKERNFAISNVKLDFELEDALKLKSKPSQTLSFGSLRFNDFIIDNGKISFQTESLDNYLIEKSEFKWCNGNIASNAFRINAKKPGEMNIALYCDRLNVSEVLNQLQLGKASGKGNISGKIPLIYKNKRIHVNEGFLYSTPGIGGNISLTDFMGPLANIQKDIGTEIATEALKDFDYNWLKIKLNSEKKDLLLILELDGKPAPEFLPFTVDLSNGILRKSTDPNLRAKFKGLSFQINFRLPANQMLDYGTKWQTISEKLK